MILDAILSSEPRLVTIVLIRPLMLWEAITSVHVGLLAQRDGWLDEGALYVARNALAGEGGRSMSLTGACWPGTRPKMWH